MTTITDHMVEGGSSTMKQTWNRGYTAVRFVRVDGLVGANTEAMKFEALTDPGVPAMGDLHPDINVPGSATLVVDRSAGPVKNNACTIRLDYGQIPAFRQSTRNKATLQIGGSVTQEQADKDNTDTIQFTTAPGAEPEDQNGSFSVYNPQLTISLTR